MNVLFIILTLLVLLAFLTLTITYICFRIVFYVPRKKDPSSEEILVPTGEIYEPYHDMMKKWI